MFVDTLCIQLHTLPTLNINIINSNTQ